MVSSPPRAEASAASAASTWMSIEGEAVCATLLPWRESTPSPSRRCIASLALVAAMSLAGRPGEG